MGWAKGIDGVNLESGADILNISDSQQFKAAMAIMDIVKGLLSMMGRVQRPFISRKPSGISEYRTMLVSPLMDRKRSPVGEIRVYVLVGANGGDATIRVEWTRNAFGFWYRKDVVLSGVVGEPYGADLSEVKNVFKFAGKTADGTVILKSMNRMFRKVKKNKARDNASKLGLMVG